MRRLCAFVGCAPHTSNTSSWSPVGVRARSASRPVAHSARAAELLSQTKRAVGAMSESAVAAKYQRIRHSALPPPHALAAQDQHERPRGRRQDSGPRCDSRGARDAGRALRRRLSQVERLDPPHVCRRRRQDAHRGGAFFAVVPSPSLSRQPPQPPPRRSSRAALASTCATRRARRRATLPRRTPTCRY